MAASPLYRVIFLQQGELWELYARDIYQSELWGFLEIEGFVFGDASKVVVDPSTERLRRAFEGVSRSYLPINAVVRIDEVEREGTPRATKAEGNVTAFPGNNQWPPRSE
ncbi:DUF1820 family protein [Kushneria phosphatilytica]|uniref:DUF1820 family protein n=1 Tax=Kushneria phosphatilytica TaxID=657387 RepID=A0A1S1NT05_9GAMM|nr:DUF1820 family protein [Kushneria phosphatilytica]OHV12394.1 hypothetical protein BH688_06750 [Kushneria phosphatilytica]QEL11519.1 DUF1820 family protein [Kushneria phosphatilytica]